MSKLREIVLASPLRSTDVIADPSGLHFQNCEDQNICAYVPLNFIVLEDLPFRVVADVSNIDEAAQVEPLRSKLRHGVEPGC